MKSFAETVCLCGILIFKVLLCSADDGLSEAELTKIYKLSSKGNIIAATNYQIIKGEIIKAPTKKVWMKVENPVDNFAELRLETKLKEPRIPREIGVLKDLKEGKKDLLGECVADMLNHGTYDGRTALIIPGLGKNLKEYSSKAYSWDDLSKIGPCMVKALRFLHDRNYVHRDLKPEIFAFGTEEKVAPLKNRVYLFDVGLAETYMLWDGRHRGYVKISEFVGEMTYASRAAMDNKTQCPRDDLESLFYVLSNLAGLTKPFTKTQPTELYAEKRKFFRDPLYRDAMFKKYKTEVRVLNAISDFADDLDDLFDNKDFTIEPEYDDFISCFDCGLSKEEINAKYEFVASAKKGGIVSVMLNGNTTTDPNNKMEVSMKLMKTEDDVEADWANSISFKAEVRVYKDLKKGMKRSLLRENVCDMLDYGLYDNRRAIIMPRLGLDWGDHLHQKYGSPPPFDELCRAAKSAISALRFVHKKGYLHNDLKPKNFAFGSVAVNKSDKSQADKPLKTRLYLFDFGSAMKWRYPNNKHKPRTKINRRLGSKPYMSRAALMEYSQGRRDEMESCMYALASAATYAQPFKTKEIAQMWKLRDQFMNTPGEIKSTFEKYNVFDLRVHEAFQKYADELKKLFVSDEKEYFEMEPDYNAFCVCFGGKPGDKACDVK